MDELRDRRTRSLTGEAEAQDRERIGAGRVVGIVGAGGGAGASTLAVALGVRAVAAGRSAVVVDLVSAGGGLDLVLGAESERGVRWPQLRGASGGFEGEALLERLPCSSDGVSVLSHDRGGGPTPLAVAGEAIAALRTVCDLVVLDLPRASRDWSVRPDDVVLAVGRGTVPGLAATALLVEDLRGQGIAPVAVVRDGPDVPLPVLTTTLGVEDVWLLPSHPKLRDEVDRGIPPGRQSRSDFVRACDTILRDLLVPPAGRTAA